MFSAAGKSAVTSGYNINNSLRFRSSASAYLSRTPSGSGSATTWTWSAWVKRGAFAQQALFSCAASASAGTSWRFINDTLDIFRYNGTAYNYRLTTTQVFRDPSAWYHIVVVGDISNATSSNRIKLYINGVEVTAFSTATYPTTSYVEMNGAGYAQYNGRSFAALEYFDGYLAEVNFIDGQALTPSSFGETNATTGVWQPKAYTGTYGTNGFYLPFRLNSSSGFSSHYGSFNGTTQSLSATLPSTLSGQFTIEGFIRPNVVTFNPLFTLGDSSTSTGLEFYFGGGSTPSIYSDNGFQISDSYNIPATVWAHIAVTRDASNVIRLFINGTQVGGTWTSTAAFSNTVRIGAEFYSGSITGRMNGFISNFRIVTGSALYTSTFTPPSSALTAVSGTQLLTLQNSTIIDNSTNALTVTNTGSVATTSATVGNYISDVGYEYSGNRNTWTTNNINYTTAGTTYDSMTDSPTLTSPTVGNYCVMNAVQIGGTNLTNGNLQIGLSSGNINFGTLYATSGKFYFETVITTQQTQRQIVGIANELEVTTSGLTGVTVNSWGIIVQNNVSNGQTYNNGVFSSSYTTYTTGDIVMVAFDVDNKRIWFGKNGTWLNSSNPSAGTGSFYTLTGTGFVPAITNTITAGVSLGVNFGQRPFTYTPPTGFLALNTFNLPTSTIVKGNSFMDATLYTGTGASLSVTNAAGFRPDFVWMKSRSAATDHGLYDSVRGTTNDLVSNSTAAATTQAQGLTAFNSNGFTVGTLAKLNTNTATYVGWQWRAGEGTSGSNTNGTIPSTVSVNATAGFSIVTYTGTGANGTVGHGLGVAPRMIIVKNRSIVASWNVYHASLGNTQALFLNQTALAGTSSVYWNNTSPTSTVFSLGTNNDVNGSGNLQVAYCWAEIAGFSAFGSYTGNNSADGPFVYLGFRPKFIMFKRTDSAQNWFIFDSSRNLFNLCENQLSPNLANAESTGDTNVDYLSNGFKIRFSGTAGINQSGTYIYAAFAENPFKNSLAR